MKNKANSDKGNAEVALKANAEIVWKQLEDVVAPRLRLSVVERAVYYHLLRHSRLEGKVRYHFSIASLSRSFDLSLGPVRTAVRRLVAQRAMRLIRRSKAGHVVEVRVPEEIRAARFVAAGVDSARGSEAACLTDGEAPGAVRPAEVDFMQTRALRQAIHAREGGRCFYCLRRQAATVRGLDHVVPRSLSGGNSYRNLVSCCLECNSQKGEKRAEDYLRWLYRERCLTAAELSERLRALRALAAGKLRPAVQGQGRVRGIRARK
jgi:HNH endonuclease